MVRFLRRNERNNNSTTPPSTITMSAGTSIRLFRHHQPFISYPPGLHGETTLLIRSWDDLTTHYPDLTTLSPHLTADEVDKHTVEGAVASLRVLQCVKRLGEGDYLKRPQAKSVSLQESPLGGKTDAAMDTNGSLRTSPLEGRTDEGSVKREDLKIPPLGCKRNTVIAKNGRLLTLPQGGKKDGATAKRSLLTSPLGGKEGGATCKRSFKTSPLEGKSDAVSAKSGSLRRSPLEGMKGAATTKRRSLRTSPPGGETHGTRDKSRSLQTSAPLDEGYADAHARQSFQLWPLEELEEEEKEDASFMGNYLKILMLEELGDVETPEYYKALRNLLYAFASGYEKEGPDTNEYFQTCLYFERERDVHFTVSPRKKKEVKRDEIVNSDGELVKIKLNLVKETKI